MYPSSSHIQKALNRLFGPHHGFHISSRMPDILMLKKTFRKKSLFLHPDRAKAMGLCEKHLNEEFKLLNNAYQLLIPYIRRRHPVFYYNPRYKKRKTATGRMVPKIKLRFAHFLYYRGIINFNTIIRALIWQHKSRPKVGEIAMKLNCLTHKGLLRIIRSRKVNERFLNAAVRLHMITKSTGEKIMEIQKSYRMPIGKYFIEKKLISAQRLNLLLREFHNHNRENRKESPVR